MIHGQGHNVMGSSGSWSRERWMLLKGRDVTIIPTRQDKGSAYSSKVLDVGENRLLINLPRHIAGNGYLRQSQPVSFSFLEEKLLYEASGYYRADDMHVREILLSGDAHRTTRRDFNRLSMGISVKYTPVSEFSLRSGRLNSILWKNAITQDISAGGILIQTSLPAPLKSYFLLKLKLLVLNTPLLMFGQVRWSDMVPGDQHHYHCGLSFITSEDLGRHFSPGTVAALPDVLFLFNRKKQNELDRYLAGLFQAVNKGVRYESQQVEA